MKTAMLFFILFYSLLGSATEGDGPDFLLKYPTKAMICMGTKILGGNAMKDIGRIRVDILNKESESPSVAVASEDGSIKFMIGDGYRGSLTRSENCRYYSTNEAVYYICNLIDPSTPITFYDVMKADVRSSFSQDLVCARSPSCIRLQRCTSI